ncbi:MAG: UTP--glucose-1-phosphate uridylyltransferase GalU [Dongiaceae bacterium]
MKPLRKAIFPVGGLGTRFLPATKVLPKEMLPIVDTPLIQYAVEEARAAGIEQFIFVTGRGKSAIEDHFDHNIELNEALRRRKRTAEREAVGAMVMKPGQFVYLRQQQPLGLGHAVWCARNLIDDEPIAILLPDDLIQSRTPCLKQMADLQRKVGGNMIAVMEVPREQTARYGVVTPGRVDGRLIDVKGLVEKPLPENAPSNLAVIGRYILEPAVFGHLDGAKAGAGGEIQLTDALAKLIGGNPFNGYRFEGKRFDCGDKAGFFEATIAFALQHESIGSRAAQIIRGVVEPISAPSKGASRSRPAGGRSRKVRGTGAAVGKPAQKRD